MCSAAFVLACLACMHNALGVNTRAQGPIEQDAKNTLSALLLAMTSPNAVGRFSAVARKQPTRMADLEGPSTERLFPFLVKKLLALDEQLVNAKKAGDEEEVKRVYKEVSDVLNGEYEELPESLKNLMALEEQLMNAGDEEEAERAGKEYSEALKSFDYSSVLEPNSNETKELETFLASMGSDKSVSVEEEVEEVNETVAAIYNADAVSDEEKKLLIFSALVGEEGLASLLDDSDTPVDSDIVPAVDPLSELFSTAKESEALVAESVAKDIIQAKAAIRKEGEDKEKALENAFEKYEGQVPQKIEKLLSRPDDLDEARAAVQAIGEEYDRDGERIKEAEEKLRGLISKIETGGFGGNSTEEAAAATEALEDVKKVGLKA